MLSRKLNFNLFSVCRILRFKLDVAKMPMKPPERVKLMTTLDKSQFESSAIFPILNIDNSRISKAMPIVKKYSFKMRSFKPLQKLNDNDECVSVILNPDKIKAWSHFDVDDRKALEELSVDLTNFSSRTFSITYDNYNADEIFKAVLPEDGEGFSAFSQIGHIVHVNLRDHLMPYKFLIGQVLFDKVANVKTVVNKVNEIDNTYRYFKMEVLHGVEDNMIVKIKENRCTFEFDFSKVYWNPRLSTEHQRVTDSLKAGDVLFDVFAGVGPFAVPAAKKKCIVFANDLNPESFRWLNRNSQINKIDSRYLVTFNKDGKDFIMSDLKMNLLKFFQEDREVRIVMNLPQSAVEFLNVFHGLYDSNELTDEMKCTILVQVYCFAKGEDCVEIAKRLVVESVDYNIEDKITEIYSVRTVSNLKEMMRISFRLTRDILVKCGNKRKRSSSLNNKTQKTCRNGEEQEKQ